MSDALKTLSHVVQLGAGREPEKDHDVDAVEEVTRLRALIETIVEVAGDSLEDHITAYENRKKAGKEPKPRKARVYKEIVDQVNSIVCDVDMTCPEATYYGLELIQELLDRYKIPALLTEVA